MYYLPRNCRYNLDVFFRHSATELKITLSLDCSVILVFFSFIRKKCQRAAGHLFNFICPDLSFSFFFFPGWWWWWWGVGVLFFGNPFWEIVTVDDLAAWELSACCLLFLCQFVVLQQLKGEILNYIPVWKRRDSGFFFLFALFAAFSKRKMPLSLTAKRVFLSFFFQTDINRSHIPGRV